MKPFLEFPAYHIIAQAIRDTPDNTSFEQSAAIMALLEAKGWSVIRNRNYRRLQRFAFFAGLIAGAGLSAGAIALYNTL